MVVKDAGVFVGRPGEARQQIGLFPQGGIDEEAADRRQFGGKRIQRLLRARRVTQRAKHRDQIAVAMLYRAQAVERRERASAAASSEVLIPANSSGQSASRGRTARKA